MVEIIKDSDIQLPPEVLAEMPSGLTRIDQFKWRRNKANELKAKAALSNQGVFQTAASDSSKAEKSEANGKPVSETTADSNLSNDEVPTKVEEEASNRSVVPPKSKSEPKSKSKSKSAVSANASQSKRKSSDYKDVRDIHCSVLTALRRLFPYGASNGDMLTAVVYIITNGDCEISEQAMQLVRNYGERDSGADIAERLSNIERMLRDGTRMWQSIELCTCYNTFDRRYGSKERRVSPGKTEFREQGNLDMLDRLRQQADDQLKVDSIERGRDIYNLTKDKNDKK